MAARLHITGASGAGVSTLGAALAARLGVAWFDTDAFYWQPSDPPFQQARPMPTRLARLRAALARHDGWVLSGSLDGWGDRLIPQFDAVVWLYAPTETRIARLRAREAERYGAAIAPGGPMQATHEAFIAWAEGYDTGVLGGRSLPRHLAWLDSLPCPVLRLDGTWSTSDLVATVCAARGI